MNNRFRSKDLYLAGLIYAKGIKLSGVVREGSVCFFEFEKPMKCMELQQKFFSRSVNVNAKEYSDALRTLKTLIFAN